MADRERQRRFAALMREHRGFVFGIARTQAALDELARFERE